MGKGRNRRYLFHNAVVIVLKGQGQDVVQMIKDGSLVLRDNLAIAQMDGVTHQPPLPLLMFL